METESDFSILTEKSTEAETCLNNMNMDVRVTATGTLFYAFTYFAFRKVLKKFKALSRADVYVIAEKSINVVHGIVCTVVGTIIALNCRDDIMTDRHWLTNWFACFGLPYFPCDIWAMYNSHYFTREEKMRQLSAYQILIEYMKNYWDLLAHHILLPVIFLPTILFYRNGIGDYFIGVFYTCEIVIIFIGIRFILVQLKLKNSPMYLMFGLLMIFVFFVSRILVFPFLYWKYGTFAGIPFTQVMFRIPVKCNLGCLVILILQAYFLYLMLRGAFRAFYKIYLKNKNKNQKSSVD